VIDNYDAPPAITLLATAVTSIICTCDDGDDVDPASLALGLETGMVVALSEPAIAAVLQAREISALTHSDHASLLDVAERIGCAASPAVVLEIATMTISHVEGLRSVANVKAPEAPPLNVEIVHQGLEPDSLETLLAEMEAANIHHRFGVAESTI